MSDMATVCALLVKSYYFWRMTLEPPSVIFTNTYGEAVVLTVRKVHYCIIHQLRWLIVWTQIDGKISLAFRCVRSIANERRVGLFEKSMVNGNREILGYWRSYIFLSQSGTRSSVLRGPAFVVIEHWFSIFSASFCCKRFRDRLVWAKYP